MQIDRSQAESRPQVTTGNTAFDYCIGFHGGISFSWDCWFRYWTMKACIILNHDTEPIGLYTRPKALNERITTNPRKSDFILKICGVRKTTSYLSFLQIKLQKCSIILQIDLKESQCKLEWPFLLFLTYVCRHTVLQIIEIILQKFKKSYLNSEQLAAEHIVNAPLFLIKIIRNIISVCCLHLGQSLRKQIKMVTYGI